MRYAVYLGIVVLVAMGLERDLLFWNWQWNLAYGWRQWVVNKRVFLALLALAACVGTLQLATLKNRAARVLVFLYLVISLGFVFFYTIQEDRVPVMRDTMVAFDGIKDMYAIGKTVFQVYPRQLFLASAASVVISAGLMLVGKRNRELAGKAIPVWLAFAAYGAAMAFFCVEPEREHQIPVFIRTPVLVINGLKASYSLYSGMRAEPVLEPKLTGEYQSHILFIMDETIIGKDLSLNGFEFDTTPYLRTLADRRFYNYGIACSAGNLSSVTNILVVSGLRPDEIPDHDQKSMHQASIFGYAKKAGRKTYYIDAQNIKLMNYMYARDFRDFEFRKIFFNDYDYDSKAVYAADVEAMAMAEEIIKGADRPAFIFLLKTGCHNPYENKYPEDADYPDLNGISSTRRPYYYALRWNVDEFMQEVSRRLADTNTLVVYTGDHGEDLTYLEGNRIVAHGNMDNPDPVEANVPIMVWAMSEQANEDFLKAGGFNAKNVDKASHFQLFSTMLILMGYDRREAGERHGPSLFDDPLPFRGFVSGDYLDFARLQGVQWLNPFDTEVPRNAGQ